MKQLKFTREIILWLIMLIPVAYLTLSWEALPELVPVHFNLKGEADGWAGKSTLIWITLFATLGLYFLMLVIPRIDPKRKLDYMGDKYDQLRTLLVFFMSALVMFIIYHAQNQGTPANFNFLILLIGAMIAAFGNYFQAIKPNYFVGIRTPWTLESETVWRKTHRLGGRIWLAGGLLIMVLAFTTLPGIKEVLLLIIFATIALIPVVYSFLESRNEQRQNTAHS